MDEKEWKFINIGIGGNDIVSTLLSPITALGWVGVGLLKPVVRRLLDSCVEQPLSHSPYNALRCY